jgi:hypothetical protein
MSKKLYLHIGLPKTGTSYLQFFLCNNDEFLNAEGKFYPNLETGLNYSALSGDDQFNGNAFPLAYTYLDLQSITNCPVKGVGFRRLSELLSAENRDVVLSSEWCTLIRPFIVRVLHNLALSHGFKMEIICYIRRQDFLLESNYNQRIKMDRSYISFENYFYVPDFFKILNSFIDVLPDESIQIRCLEKNQLHNGDLIDDFLKCIGICNSQNSIRPGTLINQSLSYAALNLINLMNFHGFGASPAMDYLMIELRTIQSNRCLPSKPGWLSPLQRIQLLQQVQESNSALSSRFLDPDRDSLFFESIPGCDSEWVDARDQVLNPKELMSLIERLSLQPDLANMKEIVFFLYRYLDTLEG